MKSLFKTTSSLITTLLIILSFCNAQVKDFPKREFRGIWIATVVNIDWPSKPGLPSDVQKSELINILNQHQKNGINAIMFQVRPATDAFYAISDEPWSQYLTGKQGQAPVPFYDPLAFAIEECHKRGMELHAWFNPYRATFDGNENNIAINHITKKQPDWFFKYDGKKLFNPGIPEVRSYIIKTILNVVDHYDIDGVHFDDYFYPYAIKGQIINDFDTFKKYNDGIKSIDDWRRNNVDVLVRDLNDSIHQHKNYIKFGISPFGIWKNKSQDVEGSLTNGGDSYFGIYADSRKWVKEGWVDYINPQIYWAFETKAAPFSNLVDWWGENSFGGNLYIGHGAYKINATKDLVWRNSGQLGRQLNYIRQNPNIQGSVFFSSKSITNNPLGVADSLASNYYKRISLPPLMHWLDSIAPNKPQNLKVKKDNNSINISWSKPQKAIDNDEAYGYVVYRFEGNAAPDINNAEAIKAVFYSKSTAWQDTQIEKDRSYTYVVTALDRVKNESEPSEPILFKIDKSLGM